MLILTRCRFIISFYIAIHEALGTVELVFQMRLQDRFFQALHLSSVYMDELLVDDTSIFLWNLYRPRAAMRYLESSTTTYTPISIS